LSAIAVDAICGVNELVQILTADLSSLWPPTDLGGHAMIMTAFGGLGYYLHGIEGRQNELIAKKKEQILQNRERLSQGSSKGDDEE
jgi:hypothetical protein